ncbi:hypothetical protein CI109_104272 [Kwoniella shandongensis]|uniref:Uncharacterized protein n=1 Tax=Kwoniella shandongensis TaxID=1734106 RepID=A0A5M6C105_9TREE|nr:uncharacterized protein CI109_002822 [Kwoniella shandongensis]KAA5528664.1 hypothetical protein CI109_002822 [Kwoniella shandongensis]
MAATASDNAPVPLRLPAILQNPTNHALRQVEAYNAQQREKAQARREAKTTTRVVEKSTGRGKRVIRRLDNAAFTSNPHIVQPSRSDYNPPVPLQHRPSRPSFPSDAIPRSAAIPSVSPPDRDPFSSNSLNGAFSTSLKGTRALLRKRGGRRVEGLVGKVEEEIRGWLGGNWGDLNHSIAPSEGDESWKVIDDNLVDHTIHSGESSTSSASSSRRMPTLHQITSALPILPLTGEDPDQIPAILEISRSPAHLSWLVSDSFERLVVHLIARYYELVSWSDSHVTTSGQNVRLTHIILPNVAKPKPLSQKHDLFTPETSEVSGQSGSEIPTSDSELDVRGRGFHSETDSEAATQRGADSESESEFGEEGYTLVQDPNVAITPLPEMIGDLALSDVDSDVGMGLRRTISNTSSRYASSEGGSEYSSMGDSLTLPPVSSRPPGAAGAAVGGWIEFESGLGEVPRPVIPISVASIRARTGVPSLSMGAGQRDWEDKPTFFEFLYGA